MGSLGWPEILIILVIALIIFGPRKLPELGKTLGQSLAQFRRASEDFKRTWEEEVEIEKRKLEAPPPATVDYSSTTDPYEGQDFSLDGSHTGAVAETAPLVEGSEHAVEGSEHTVEGSEHAVAGSEHPVEVASDGSAVPNGATSVGDAGQIPVDPKEAAAALAERRVDTPKHDHA